MDFNDINRFFIDVNKNINKSVNKVKEKIAVYEEPYSEISQNNEHIEIMVKLPKVNRRSITLTLGTNSIKIKGQKKMSDASLTTLPRVYYRSILLPNNSNNEKVKTKFKNDVLKIKIPLKQKKK